MPFIADEPIRPTRGFVEDEPMGPTSGFVPEAPTIPEFREARPLNLLGRIKQVGRRTAEVAGLAETPEQRKAHAQNLFALSKTHDIPLTTARKYEKELGEEIFGKRPTTMDIVSLPVKVGVLMAAPLHPIRTALGVASFMALDEMANYLVSKGIKERYRLGAGLGLKELLPEEATQQLQDVVDVADFALKVGVMGTVYKKAPVVGKKLTKQVITKYNLPREVVLSKQQVRDLWKTGRLTSAEQKDLFKTLDLSRKQRFQAIKEGVKIRVPSEKVVTLVDKPYWAKVKGVLRIRPTEPIVTRVFPEKPARAPAGLLAREIPARPEVPSAIPERPPEVIRLPAPAVARPAVPVRPEVVPEVGEIKEVVKEKVYRGITEQGKKRFPGEHYSADIGFAKRFGKTEAYTIDSKNILNITNIETVNKLFGKNIADAFKTGDFWKMQPDQEGFNYRPMNKVIEYAKEKGFDGIKYIENYSKEITPTNYVVLKSEIIKPPTPEIPKELEQKELVKPKILARTDIDFDRFQHVIKHIANRNDKALLSEQKSLTALRRRIAEIGPQRGAEIQPTEIKRARDETVERIDLLERRKEVFDHVLKYPKEYYNALDTEEEIAREVKSWHTTLKRWKPTKPPPLEPIKEPKPPITPPKEEKAIARKPAKPTAPKEVSIEQFLTLREEFIKKGIVPSDYFPEQFKADQAEVEKKLGRKLRVSETKKIIREVTGVGRKKDIITKTEIELIKFRLQAERRGVKAGERVGRVETRKKIYRKIQSKKTEMSEIRTGILNYAQDNLTKADRSRIALLATRTKSHRGMAKVMTMIDKMEERYQRHVAVSALKKTVKNIDVRRTRPEYKLKINDIADSLDLVNRRDRTIKGLTSMADFINRNPEHNIPERAVARLAILGRTPIKNLTTDDINLIRDSISDTVKQHDLKNKLLLKGKVRDFKKIRDRAVENVKEKVPVETDPRKGIVIPTLREFLTTEANNIEHIARHIEGDHEVIAQVEYDGIDHGVSETLRIRQEANDYFWNGLKGITDEPGFLRWSETFHPRKNWRNNVSYHTYKLASGKRLVITKGERLSIELLSRREQALRHLLVGGLRLSSNPEILYKITGEDLDMITKDVLSSPSQKKVANAMHRHFNTTQKDNLNEVSVRLNGWEIATADDYFPIKIHGADITRNYLTRGEALPTNMQKFTRTTLEGMGMLKETVPANNPLLLEDAFSTVYKSIKQTSTYYGMAEPLRSAKALLFDSEFRSALNTRYGKHYWKAFEHYLRDIEGEYQQTYNVDKMVTGWINRLDLAVFGINVIVYFKQPISLMAVGTEVDTVYMQKGLKERPVSRELMGKWSPQLRDRFEGRVTREKGEISSVGEVRKFWTHKRTLGQNTVQGLSRFDYESIGRIWNIIKHETEALHPSLKGDDKLKHIATRTEEVVRLTQPTFHTKDRSAIGRSRQIWIRLMTKYTSQRNKNYMMVQRAVSQYNRSNQGPQAKRKLMKSLSIVMLLMPLLLYGLDEIRNWAYKRKRPERRLRYRILKFLELNLGNIYFVGNAFRSISSKVERGKWAGYDMSDVLMSWGTTGVNAVADTIAAIDQTISQERFKAGDKKGQLKWRTTAKRAANEAASFALRMRGIPYDTARRYLLIPFSKGQKKKPYTSPTRRKKSSTRGRTRVAKTRGG